jgi:hypothetical protein
VTSHEIFLIKRKGMQTRIFKCFSAAYALRLISSSTNPPFSDPTFWINLILCVSRSDPVPCANPCCLDP